MKITMGPIISQEKIQPCSADTVASLFEIPETPDEIELTQGQRLVSIGDIHGNLSQLKACLIAAQVMDKDDDWCGGNTVLVQVGDVLDRGIMEFECLLLLCRLAREAALNGGVLILLWGNHELDNAIGDFGAASTSTSCRKTLDIFEPAVAAHHDDADWKDLYHSKLPVRRALFEPGGLLAKPLLSKLKIAVKVGRSILVHAGLKVEHLIRWDWDGISGMNRVVREWILQDAMGKQERMPMFKPPNTISDLWYNGKGPCFDRDYSFPSNKEIESDDTKAALNAVLKLLDVDRMVVGHSPQEMIRSNMDGKVWCIDIGNGIPPRLQFSTRVDPGQIRSEALEISLTLDWEEEVAILRCVKKSRKKGDHVVERTVCK